MKFRFVYDINVVVKCFNNCFTVKNKIRFEGRLCSGEGEGRFIHTRTHTHTHTYTHTHTKLLGFWFENLMVLVPVTDLSKRKSRVQCWTCKV